MPARKNFSNSALAEIIKQREQGATLPQIAKTHSCSIPTINRLLRESGVVFSAQRAGFNVAKGRFLSEQEKLELVKLYVAGKSIQAVAEALRISKQSVRTMLHLSGVGMRTYTAKRTILCTDAEGRILCKTCEQWKQGADFFKSKAASNGRTSSCKACMIQVNRTRATGLLQRNTRLLCWNREDAVRDARSPLTLLVIDIKRLSARITTIGPGIHEGFSA